MGIGGFTYLLGELKLFSAESRTSLLNVGETRQKHREARRRPHPERRWRLQILAARPFSPAYLGVGYIIGPHLGALNFAGGLLAWGLMVPLLAYFFMGPEISSNTLPARLGH
ncbi:MAG: hypothetical protein QM757_41350 [Paludibaculum sp.]